MTSNNLFNYVNSVSQDGIDIWNENSEKEYNPYMMNRAMSQNPDTIAFATMGNAMVNISKHMHYIFLLHGVEKRKRYSKWAKSSKLDDFQMRVAQHFQCNYERAKEFIDAIGEKKLKSIFKEVDRLEKGQIK